LLAPVLLVQSGHRCQFQPNDLLDVEKERIGYAIRIPANEVLEGDIADLLIRPVGRPSAKPKMFYAECTYRAES
jgi:hypothetical protein